MTREPSAKLDDRRDRITLTMNSTAERDMWCRAVPLKVPDGFRQCIAWDAAGMKLSIWYEEVPVLELSKKPPATAYHPGAPFNVEQQAQRAKLAKWALKDLLTRCAELGIAVDRTRVPKPDDLAAAIIRKEAENAAQPPTPDPVLPAASAVPQAAQATNKS